MCKKEIIEVLDDFLNTPEIKAIPWVNCLRAAQEKYGFSEQWFVEQLEKARQERQNDKHN